MRNHFDWSPDDQDLNRINRIKYQGHTNLRELSRAERVISQLKQDAFDSLKKMKYITAHDIKAASFDINDLVMHAQGLLHDITNEIKINDLLNKVKIESYKIVAKERLLNILNLKILQIDHAALTNKQKSTAITEAKSMFRYSKDNLNQSQTENALTGTYVSGVSAIKGALAKYVIESQSYIKHQLISLVTKIKHMIAKQPNLNQTAKNITCHKIELIQSNALNKLTSTDNFIDLKRIQHNSVNRLMKISTGKSRVLVIFTTFSQFVSQVKKLVTQSSEISLNTKLRLDYKIDQYQKATMVDFQVKTTNEKVLNIKERNLAKLIVKAVSKMYQQGIAAQKLSLSSKQRSRFINHLKKITNQIIQDIQDNELKGSILSNLTTDLQLLGTASKRKNILIYRNRIRQYIYSIESQIDQFPDLSDADQRYLHDQVINFSRQVQQQRTKPQLSALKQSLKHLFDKQIEYLCYTALIRDFTNVSEQVQLSHLSQTDRKDLQQRITNIKQDRRLDYDNKRLSLNRLNNYGLDLDKVINRRQLTELSKDVYEQANPLDQPTLQNRLDRNISDFSQKTENLNQISDVDHQEQLHENQVYDSLYHLIKYSFSIKSKAFSRLMARLEAAHHQIDAAVLAPRLNRLFNDCIDQYFNGYLHQVLHSKNIKEIKRSIKMASDNLDQQFNSILLTMRTNYINDYSQLVNDVRYQLMAYSPSNRVLAKISMIRSQAVGQIRRANTLYQIEYTKQINARRLYNLANYVIDTIDVNKKVGHLKIHQMVTSTKKMLNVNEGQPVKNDLILINRVLMVANQTNHQINVELDKNVDREYIHGQQMLDQVLRHGYQHRLIKIAHRSQLLINIMANISSDVKIRLNELIDKVKLETFDQIKRCDQSDLVDTLNSGNERIQQIIQRTIILDPLKKKIYKELSKLIDQAKDCVKKFMQPREGMDQLSSLDKIDANLKTQIGISNDKNIHLIYRREQKRLNALQMNIIHKSQLNRFAYFTHKMGERISDLPLLSNSEINDVSTRFNKAYHKTVYDINKSPDAMYCVHNEHRGEHNLKQLFVQVSQINDRKATIFDQISVRITRAKKQIQALEYLKSKDRLASYKLLDQTQQRAKQNIKESSDLNGMEAVKDRCVKMAKKVVDDVSSADVLLAAIQSANDRISNSTLDKSQKDATLHQIHQIIKIGVMDQIKSSTKKSKSNKSNNDQKSNSSRLNSRRTSGTKSNAVIKNFDSINSDRSSMASSASEGTLKKFFGKLGKVF